jgi:hypothetical protein
MIHPVILGKGAKLFDEPAQRRELQLADMKRFATGIVVLELTPKIG